MERISNNSKYKVIKGSREKRAKHRGKGVPVDRQHFQSELEQQPKYSGWVVFLSTDLKNRYPGYPLLAMVDVKARYEYFKARGQRLFNCIVIETCRGLCDNLGTAVELCSHTCGLIFNPYEGQGCECSCWTCFQNQMKHRKKLYQRKTNHAKSTSNSHITQQFKHKIPLAYYILLLIMLILPLVKDLKCGFGRDRGFRRNRKKPL